MKLHKRGLVTILFFASVILLLNSCSLLKFNFESDATPLDSELLKTRMQVHNFGITFFHEVMVASDSILKTESDKTIQINALTWKIDASQAAKNKIFQSNPEIALLDTWLLTASMTDYLKEGAGANLFGNSQPIAVDASERLLSKIDTIAANTFSDNYNEARAFIDSIRINEPFESTGFYRETVFNDWYRYQNIPDSLIDFNNGTLPQVLSDFSTRMAIGTEQTMRETQWSGEKLLKQSNIDSLDIQKMADDFNKQFEELIVVLRNSGRTMQEDAIVMHRDIAVFSHNLDENFDSLMVIATRELTHFRDSLGVEREAIMEDLDKTSNKLVKTAMVELHAMVKDILFYVLLILIVILFIPFGLGFITGKTLTKKKNKE